MRCEEESGPDITLAGLEIWVHDRQFPDIEDYWDGNWMNVVVRCMASGATVEVSGPIIHLPEIASLLQDSEALQAGLEDKAELSCMEPELSFTLETADRGQINMAVTITPNHLTQKHEFIFEIDQSNLARFIQECKVLLAKYPVRGKPS